MEQTVEPLVVGVRFGKVGKVYHFAADAVTDLKVGDMVVVETSRGWQLGQVAQVVPNPEPPPEGWKAIDRRATPRDLLLRQMWQMKEAEVVSNCRAKSADLKLSGIKIVSAEYSFDGSRLTIQFSSETEEKYDLKSLRQDMQKMFAPSQVEMRQIGPRDVAKTVCGMGACGLETRCCCMFLTEFSSISIRMAKEQGISLTPTEITGMCGRLRCCLIYEYDTYVEARQKLPKRNKRVRTPQGDGKVVDVIPLRGAVMVDLPEVGWREFPGSDVQVLDGSEGPSTAGTQPPFQGTQQASEMDKAITGDETVKPFEVSPQTREDRAAETPPAEERPRSMPRPGGPRGGGGRPERGGQRPGAQGRPGGRDQGGGRAPAQGEAPARREPTPGSEPGGGKGKPEQRRERGQRPGGGRGPGQRREDQPRGGSPAGGAPVGGSPSESQPRPGEESLDATKPKNPSGGVPPARNRQDQRRKRVRRRDNNDTENRT